jgi:hypothetical protein
VTDCCRVVARDVRSGRVRFLAYFWPNRNRNRLLSSREVTNRNRNCGQPVGHGCLTVATRLRPVETINLYIFFCLIVQTISRLCVRCPRCSFVTSPVRSSSPLFVIPHVRWHSFSGVRWRSYVGVHSLAFLHQCLLDVAGKQ